MNKLNKRIFELVKIQVWWRMTPLIEEGRRGHILTKTEVDCLIGWLNRIDLPDEKSPLSTIRHCTRPSRRVSTLREPEGEY